LEPTVSPSPVSLNIDTAPAFQAIRESYYAGGEGKGFASAVSPDAHLVAFAGCENGSSSYCTKSVFRLINADTGQVIRDLESLSPVIEVLTFSPDGKVLAAAGCDITLALYGETDTICDKPRAWLLDPITGKALYEMKGYQSNVTSMVFSPDGTKLYTSVIFSRNSGKGDYSIHIYDVATGNVISTLVPQIETYLNLSFTLNLSPDGRYLITDAVDLGDYYSSFVEWWDVQDPVHPRTVARVGYSTPFRISPEDTRLVAQTPQDKTLELYNLDTGKLVKPIPVLNSSNLEGFDFVNDANTLLLDYGTELDIIRIDTGETIKRIKPGYDLLPPKYKFSPDHRLMLTMGYLFNGGEEVTKSMSIWDTSTWQEVLLPVYPTDGLSSSTISFNSDLTRLYALSDFYTSASIVTWGFPDASQTEAENALVQYFNLLASANYAQAAGLIAWDDQHSFFDMIKSKLPKLDLGNLPAVLKDLCTDPVYPCLPVKDVLYRAQLADGDFRFVINFRAPDGNIAPWPLCANIPMSEDCTHRSGMFVYEVIKKEDGTFSMLNGLPPSIDLQLK
jgi:WD40 repeat protein